MLSPSDLQKINDQIGAKPTSSPSGAATPTPQPAASSGYDAYRAQYLADRGIKDATTTTAEKGPGLLDRIGTDLGQRVSNLGDVAKNAMENKQNPVSNAWQAITNVLGAGADIGGEIGKSAVSALTPEAIKEPVTKFVSEHIVPALKPLADRWDEYAKANPEEAKNMKGLGDLLNFVATVDVGAGAMKGVTKVGEAVGKGVEGLGKAGVEGAAGTVAKPAVDFGKAAEELQPMMSADEKAAAAIKGQGTPAGSVFKKAGIATNPEDARLAQKFYGENEHLPGKGPVLTTGGEIPEKLNTLKQHMDEIGKTVRQPLLDESKKIFNPNTLKAVLNKSIKENPVLFATESKAGSTYKMLKNTLLKAASDHPNTAAGFQKALEAFDDAAEGASPGVWTRGTPANKMFMNLRKTARDFMANLTTDPEKYKAVTSHMSDIYKVQATLGEKFAHQVGKTKLDLFLKDNPVIAKSLRAGARVTGLDALMHFLH